MKHRAPEGALWFSSGSSFGRWNTCDPYLAKPVVMRLVDGGPISNRRQLSLQDCRMDTMYPGLPEESRAGFPRGGRANAVYLFQKSPARNDAGLIDPSFTAELANQVDSGYGSAGATKEPGD